MRGLGKIVVWTLVFAACATVGAVVAANTDPFPPGVEDPGVRSSVTPTSTPEPSATGGSWLVRIDTRTYHDLFVGGRCAANWRIDVGIAVAQGPIEGAGAAVRKSDLRCDEPTAQVQAERIELRAIGRLSDDGVLRFSLEETGRDPAGSQELSGFLDTIPTLVLKMPARDGATASFDFERPDGGQGAFGAAGTVVLTAAVA